MRGSKFVALVSLALSLTGCAGTKFINTWADPAAQPIDWSGQKIAAIVVNNRDAIRLGAEESLARELTRRGAQGVAGYKIVPTDVIQDKEKVKELLTQEEIVGAVVMRVVNQSQEISSSPGNMWYTGTYYPSFYGYWGYGWSMAYQPGSIRTDTIVSIETLVYSVDEDKLLWAGRSKTTNPATIPELMAELVSEAGKEIRKTGLVAR